MKRSVLNDDFFASLRSSILGTTEAESLPPACYVDDEFFAFEKETLFFREWLCVGRESWAAKPGDYFTSTHVGEPIVVARTRAGELKAMSSVCQHRGMLVAEGSGNTKAFVCPYHHWTYGLDGVLLGAPEMDKTWNFDKTRFGLPPLKVEVWRGFVFVNFDPDAEPLAPRLREIDEVVSRFELEAAEGPQPTAPTRYPWNWKVMFENNNDGYHANRLHKGPLHDFVPSSLARFPELPDDATGYYRFNGSLHPDASFNATRKALLPVFPKLTDEDRKRVLFVNVPPTLSLVMTTDLVLFLTMHAEGANQHSMGMGVLVAPGAMDNPLFNDLLQINNSGVAEIVAQDLHVDEMVQIGLRSRYAPRGRYSWQEGAQRQFNVWLVDRYSKRWSQYRDNKTSDSSSLPA
jgi:phenylpropionate dioxygenase-like ring-hydroxylating dioxygenase large terminal subunit